MIVTSLTIFFSALSNINGHGKTKSDAGILLLTEAGDNDYFAAFSKKAKGHEGVQDIATDGIQKTAEESSLIFKQNGDELYILAGRQIVTREKIEILTIGSTRRIKDGISAEELVASLTENNEFAVLAWGVGKWFASRGRLVRRILEKYASPYLFIGDNSARPIGWGEPFLYAEAKARGIRLLAGSDPLPFCDEYKRPGSYGFMLEGEFDPERPAASVKHLLYTLGKDVKLFGRRDNLLTFVKRQGKMFNRKYLS